MGANGLLFKDEAYAIIGAAMEVHSQLGPGFLEGVYGDALALELTERAIPFQREVDIPVHYKGSVLSHSYHVDFLVFNQILVELKAIKNLGDVERAQALNYLKATGLQLALLLNFGSAQLDRLRLVHTF